MHSLPSFVLWLDAQLLRTPGQAGTEEVGVERQIPSQAGWTNLTYTSASPLNGTWPFYQTFMVRTEKPGSCWSGCYRLVSQLCIQRLHVGSLATVVVWNWLCQEYLLGKGVDSTDPSKLC